MSLEHEMLVMNDQYQATMQENEELKERVAALEKLTRDQRAYLLEIAPHSYQDGQRTAPLREQWAALFEGKYELLQQE